MKISSSHFLPLIFKPTFCAIALAVALNAAPSARASLLTYDGFTADTAGNTNIVGQGGGIGWGGNWNSGQSDGFLHTVRTPTTLAYTGYTAATTPAASGGNYLNLAAGFNGANPAAVFRPLDVSAGGNYGLNGYLLNATTIGADNKVLWGSILYSNSDVNPGNSTKTFTLNGGGTFTLTLPQTSANNLLVFRINFGAGATDTFTYFSNPNLATFNGTTGGVTSAAGDYSFSNFVLTEQATGVTAGSGTEGQYDDIRFGTTLADVSPSTVPEPSTYVALGLAGAALVAFRRKSRRMV